MTRIVEDAIDSPTTPLWADLCAAALKYADRGWYVLPCRQSDKVPLKLHGWKDATADPGQIARWWKRWPDANVAIATGPSGLLVVDIDDKPGAEDAWLRLVDVLGEDSCDTLTARSGGGGMHKYFQAPGNLGVSSSAGRLGRGIDIRAAGGYILAPPSRHPSGGLYVWETDFDGGVLAPLPAGLRGLLLAHDASRSIDATSSCFVAGQRNSTLTSLAGSMRQLGMGPVEIAAVLHVINQLCGLPPLEAREVDAIAKSVGRYPPRPRRAEPRTIWVGHHA
jgi:hypothetical protein